MMARELSIVVPACCSQETFREKIGLLDHFVGGLSIDYEIIVVDDGGHRFPALNDEASSPSVRILRNATNSGKGYSVRRGMLAARGDCRMFIDVDLPFDLSIIEHALSLIQTGHFDFVAGDRTHHQSRERGAVGISRRVSSFLLREVLNLLVIGGIFDSQCGFKAFSGRLADRLFPLIRINRFSFDVEIYYLVLKYDVSFRTIPVIVTDPEPSTVAILRDGPRATLDVLSIPLRWYMGHYRSTELAELYPPYWERPDDGERAGEHDGHAR